MGYRWRNNLLVFFDSGWFAELSCGGPIQVKANHPYSGPIQDLPFLTLSLGFHRRHLVKVEIGCNAIVHMDK